MSTHDDSEAVSYVNASLAEVRERGSGHSGLFAKTGISAGDLIGCYAGRAVIIDIDPVTNRYVNTKWQHHEVWQLRRIGNHMLGLVTRSGFSGVDYINHSCNANTTVLDRIIVMAARDIKPDEEITMDYREWDFLLEGIPCWCPEPKCII
jgi:uncharacterized protein